MLKEWQFNILFFVGVGGAVLLLLGPEVGLDIAQNPTALTGVGAILTYILTQKRILTQRNDEEKKVGKHKPPDKEAEDDGPR